jgi:hypothetical protein
MLCNECKKCNWWNGVCENKFGYICSDTSENDTCANYEPSRLKNSDSCSTIEKQDYYNWIPSIECIDVVKHFPFVLGNAIKYIWRAGKKSDSSKLQDLKKAKKYIEIEIAEEKKAQ